MAEFCADCFNKMNQTDYPPEDFGLSKRLDLCEGCGEMKRVVITINSRRRRNPKEKFNLMKYIKRLGG